MPSMNTSVVVSAILVAAGFGAAACSRSAPRVADRAEPAGASPTSVAMGTLAPEASVPRVRRVTVPLPADAPGPFAAAAIGLPALAPVRALLPHLSDGDALNLRGFCPADFNKDNAVDSRDLDLFRATYANESSPIFYWVDINLDGLADERDTAEFLRVFNDGGCDPAEQQKGRLIGC